MEERKWLARQRERPTGLFGVVIDYLAHIRAETRRSWVSKPQQITEEKDGYLRYVSPSGDEQVEQDQPGEATQEREEAPPGWFDNRPNVMTREDMAFSARQEMWKRQFGLKKAVEMTRAELKRRREDAARRKANDPDIGG